jgi:hypothetical protein
MKRKKAGICLAALCAAMMFVGAYAPVAWGASSVVFDPTLSLTGSCALSELDSVADPGLCPMPPGIPGADHPSVPFDRPIAIATDSYGNIYVANQGPEQTPETNIDIFDSSGSFITEVEDPDVVSAIVVDSKGNLYVSHVGNAVPGPQYSVVRYQPTKYEPATAEIEYAEPAQGVVPEVVGSPSYALALIPATDQLFVKYPDHVTLYKSAAEGNGEIESFGFGLIAGVTGEPVGIAVDESRGRLYLGGHNEPNCTCVYVVNLAAPHELLFTIEGSAVPNKKFLNFLSLGVDEASGNLFAYDGPAKKVYEFAEDGTYLSTIEHGFEFVFLSKIWVDNGKNSPNGGQNSEGRYLFVPSNRGGKGGSAGHSYAFGPSSVCAPVVESTSVGNVGEAEAELRAMVEPCGASTHYSFEYITQQRYEEEGDSFTGAALAGEGEIPPGHAPVAIAAAIGGLQPGTAYRFRVIATNEVDSDSAEGEFATYPAAEASQPCVNDLLRTGFSALLPDCRAFELVTPPETNARAPRGAASATNLGTFFASPQASPDGGKLSFQIDGGSLPKVDATGSLAGDPYLVTRGSDGWGTSYAGPSGFEAPVILPGSTSPDQGFSFWSSEDDEGSTQIGLDHTNYVRYPDGHSDLIGRGSLASDPEADGKLISEDGSHILFVSANFSRFGSFHSAVRLEEAAPPDGTEAIYDRTRDEVTHVVSLLPGDKTPNAGENAQYAGASLDGRGVAFEIGGTLYFRYDDEETYKVGSGVTFAGIAEGSPRIFYLEGGRLWRLDAGTGERTAFNTTGTAVPVNVSADGSAAYFVSTSVLTSQANPERAKPKPGQQNLYLSQEGAISFVGVVTSEDVSGGGDGVGLGLWAPHVVSFGEAAVDPSRTTSNGNVLLFASQANLTGYDSEGAFEIYRYDLTADTLDCLSCNPTLASPSGGASLQSIAEGISPPEPLGPFVRVANLSSDGRRAFFQSTEALVPADVDGLQDVYEWEAQGKGSCARAQGCIYLISSGQSERLDYLFAVSESGDDVFFRSSDILLPSDREGTPSVYDARVGGGFPEPASAECQGEGCRSTLNPGVPPPSLGSQGVGPSGNVSKHCPKGTRKVKRHGKARCVKKKHHQHRRHKVGSSKKGGRK